MISKLLSFLSTPAYAQGRTTTSGVQTAPRIGELFTSIEGIVDLIFPIAAIIAVAMIIYGGYMWIISGGDPSKKQLAQGTLTWSVLGLVFIFLIKAILTVVVNFLLS